MEKSGLRVEAGRYSRFVVLAISLSEGAALAGECKWSVNPIGTNVLETLKQKVDIRR
jgi:hypothetical protein